MAKKKITTRKTTSRKATAPKTGAGSGNKTSSAKPNASKGGGSKAPAANAKAHARATPAGKPGPVTRTGAAGGERERATAITARGTPARKSAPPARGATKASADSNSRAARASVVEKPAKSPYNKTQLKSMREVLLQRRERVARDLNLMGDEALREGDHEIDAESVADHGTDAYERNLTLGLMEADSRTLRQIDVALQAMDEGSYGLCQECSQAIPLARLEALPFATTCVPCQERAEGGR